MSKDYKPGDLVRFTDTTLYEGKVGTIVSELPPAFCYGNVREFCVLVDGVVEYHLQPDDDFVLAEE